MINPKQSPFIRIALPFAGGIASCILFGLKIWWVSGAIPLLLIAYVFLVFAIGRSLSHRRRWIYGIFIYAILFLGGYQLAQERLLAFMEEKVPERAGETIISARLTGNPQEKERTFRARARLLAICDTAGWSPLEGEALIYFEKNDSVPFLRTGDLLLIRTPLREVAGPRNPGEYDFKRYLRFNGIRWQLYAGSDAWFISGRNEGSWFTRWTAQSRDMLLKMIRSGGMGEKEYALASAILLGYDEYLDTEQRQQFAGAGAMHILCVSGLHVGIIAMVLNQLLRFLGRNRILRFARLILLLVLIWTYAAITGFSPSVLRAATMFSFIYAGKSFRRTISIYNMLAASGFLLLLADPLMITSAGFQLSYLAVTGIVILYNPLSNLAVFNYLVPERIWQLTVVSFSATVATFPVSIYYFHQFPNLFLLTNLVAIPASFLILYNGILLLVFSFVPPLASVFGYSLNLILLALNRTVEQIEGLPFSVTRDLNPSEFQLILLFGLIASLGFMFILKSGKHLFPLLFLLILLAVSSGWRNYTYSGQKILACYSIRGHTALEFVHGRQSVFFGDSALLQNRSRLEYATNGNRLDLGVTNTAFYSLEEEDIRNPWLMKKGSLVFFAGKILVIADDFSLQLLGSECVRPDFLLVRKAAKQKKGNAGVPTNVDVIILDAALPPWEAERLRMDCLTVESNVIDLGIKGCNLYFDRKLAGIPYFCPDKLMPQK